MSSGCTQIPPSTQATATPFVTSTPAPIAPTVASTKAPTSAPTPIPTPTPESASTPVTTLVPISTPTQTPTPSLTASPVPSGDYDLLNMDVNSHATLNYNSTAAWSGTVVEISSSQANAFRVNGFYLGGSEVMVAVGSLQGSGGVGIADQGSVFFQDSSGHWVPVFASGSVFSESPNHPTISNFEYHFNGDVGAQVFVQKVTNGISVNITEYSPGVNGLSNAHSQPFGYFGYVVQPAFADSIGAFIWNVYAPPYGGNLQYANPGFVSPFGSIVDTFSFTNTRLRYATGMRVAPSPTSVPSPTPTSSPTPIITPTPSPTPAQYADDYDDITARALPQYILRYNASSYWSGNVIVVTSQLPDAFREQGVSRPSFYIAAGSLNGSGGVGNADSGAIFLQDASGNMIPLNANGLPFSGNPYHPTVAERISYYFNGSQQVYIVPEVGSPDWSGLDIYEYLPGESGQSHSSQYGFFVFNLRIADNSWVGAQYYNPPNPIASLSSRFVSPFGSIFNGLDPSVVTLRYAIGKRVAPAS